MKLRDVHGALFAYTRFKSELDVVYSSDEISTKSVHDTYE